MDVDDGTIPWSALLRETADRLGMDDARRIVEEVTGVEPGRLHTVYDELATVRGVARLDQMVQRRAAGEPLQYVLGRWGFRTLDLMVDRRVLIPRPETEEVAGFAIAVECPRARVLASDASRDALAVATANLVGIGRAATRVSMHEGDWFAALPTAVEGSLDVIVSNPPYVTDDEALPPVVGDWEPGSALRSGPEGLDALRTIVDAAPRWLADDGVLVLEMAPQQTPVVASWCETAGFAVEVRADLSGRDRAVLARRTGRR